jgi:hypothetical protein
VMAELEWCAGLEGCEVVSNSLNSGRGHKK